MPYKSGVDSARSLPTGFVDLLNGRQVPADAPGDPRRGVLDRVPCQMRIPGGGLHLRVTEQLSDHREAFA